MGHQTRRDIIRLLREQPMPVGTLADHFPISRPAISKHFADLAASVWFIIVCKVPAISFILQPDAFRLLRHYLAQFWDDALA
ncbi:MAG: ArsR family transcriptional regulator [Caldilineaceae bacterium]